MRHCTFPCYTLFSAQDSCPNGTGLRPCCGQTPGHLISTTSSSLPRALELRARRDCPPNNSLLKKKRVAEKCGRAFSPAISLFGWTAAITTNDFWTTIRVQECYRRSLFSPSASFFSRDLAPFLNFPTATAGSSAVVNGVEYRCSSVNIRVFRPTILASVNHRRALPDHLLG